MDLQILYEDNHLIAVNKAASDIVQGDKTGDKPLSEKVADFLAKKYNKPGKAFIGVIHRIDRPVSGVVIFAKTSKALSRMNQLFQKKQVQKTYWAIVKQMPPKTNDTIDHLLKKNHKQNKSYVFNEADKNTKAASLTYQLLQKLDNYFLLEITPHTGRHHQIRVQLANIGCPIKGDVKYGAKRTNADASIHLHAHSITFIHPVSKENISITAPLPQNDALWDSVDQ